MLRSRLSRSSASPTSLGRRPRHLGGAEVVEVACTHTSSTSRPGGSVGQQPRARPAHSRVPSRSPASMHSWPRLLSAIASSRVPRPASVSTAATAYSSASSLKPANQLSRDSQRWVSPISSTSPSDCQIVQRLPPRLQRLLDATRSRTARRRAAPAAGPRSAGVASAQCRSTRSYCWTASLCAPSDAARSPATSACRAASSPSPAASAWWAIRAGSAARRRPPAPRGSGGAGRSARSRGTSSTIASRASSWRNISTSPWSCSTPAPSASSRAASLPGETAAASDSSARGPARATTSSASRAGADNRAVRDSTASCTLRGTASPPAASTSVT